MRDDKVFSVLEGVYNRKWYVGKREEFRKCKESGNWVWEKNKCRN